MMALRWLRLLTSGAPIRCHSGFTAALVSKALSPSFAGAFPRGSFLRSYTTTCKHFQHSNEVFLTTYTFQGSYGVIPKGISVGVICRQQTGCILHTQVPQPSKHSSITQDRQCCSKHRATRQRVPKVSIC